MWAMSTNRSAPTSWAIAAIRSKSQIRGYARGAADDELRADLLGLRLERVVVDPLGVLADAVGVDLVEPAARS